MTTNPRASSPGAMSSNDLGHLPLPAAKDCQCQIYTHPKPLARFSTSRDHPQTSFEAVKKTVGGHRVYIDEGCDDLVLIGDGEAIFQKLALSGNRAAGTAANPSHLEVGSRQGSTTSIGGLEEAPATVVHLRTPKQKPIRFARRCPVPSSVRNRHPSYMVAVSQDDTSVDLYLPVPQRLQSPRGRGSGAPLTPHTQPFADWRCRPNNLRFGTKHYQIRSIAWSCGGAGLDSQRFMSSEEMNSFASNRSGASTASGGYVTPSVDKYLIVLTEISVDLIQVSDVPTSDPVTLIKRVVTRVDYWNYHFPSRVVALVNKQKPNIVKPFAADRGNVIRPMTQLKLTDVFEMSNNFTVSQMMDAPALNILVQPLVIRGTLYIAHFNSKNELVLYAWRSDNGNAAASPATPQSSVPQSPGMATPRSPDGRSFTSNDSFGQVSLAAGVGAWERTYILSLEHCQGSVKVQVLDNLLLTHWPLTGLSTAFDLSLAEALTNVTNQYVSSPLPRSQQDPNLLQLPEDTDGSAAQRGSMSWKDRLRGSFIDMNNVGGEVIKPTTQLYPMFAYHEADPITAVVHTPDAELPAGSLPERAPSPELKPDPDLAVDEFYNGNLPLVLDKRHGKVSLVAINPQAMAKGIKDLCVRTQFLLNRADTGGMAVPLMIRSTLKQQEPLGTVAQIFDVISDDFARKATTRTASTVSIPADIQIYGPPSWSTRCVIGSPKDMEMLLPVVSTDPYIRKACEDDTLTHEEAVSRALSDHAARFERERLAKESGVAVPATPDASFLSPDGAAISGTIDQQLMYQLVFEPLLSEMAKDSSITPPASDRSIHNASLASASALDDNCSNSLARHQALFIRYVVCALTEYARSLVQRGFRLNPSLQQLLIHAMLEGPRPDYFKLHQMVMYRAIEDHRATAQRLMRMQSQYPSAFQMGLDMLSRLEESTAVIDEFIACGMVLRAARHITDSKMTNAPVLDVLNRAATIMDVESGAYQKVITETPEDHEGAKKALQTKEDAVAVYCTVYQLLDRHLKAMNEKLPGLYTFTKRYQDLCERGL